MLMFRALQYEITTLHRAAIGYAEDLINVLSQGKQCRYLLSHLLKVESVDNAILAKSMARAAQLEGEQSVQKSEGGARPQ